MHAIFGCLRAATRRRGGLISKIGGTYHPQTAIGSASNKGLTGYSRAVAAIEICQTCHPWVVAAIALTLVCWFASPAGAQSGDVEKLFQRGFHLSPAGKNAA